MLNFSTACCQNSKLIAESLLALPIILIDDIWFYSYTAVLLSNAHNETVPIGRQCSWCVSPLSEHPTTIVIKKFHSVKHLRDAVCCLSCPHCICLQSRLIEEKRASK